jgi:hypothetical protein
VIFSKIRVRIIPLATTSYIVFTALALNMPFRRRSSAYGK